jgi:ABC-type dipeptide/oligopeptide/nickel transport system permease subunit
MAEDEKDLEKVVLTRLLRLNATVQGVVTGLVTGLAIFIATNWLVLKGGDVVGPHLSLLSQFFIGYRVSFVGSFIGLAHGFVGGFIVGYCVARIYNYVVGLTERKHLGQH